MSKRHQASRRRTYGRRQHEIRERRERGWRAAESDRDRFDDGLVRQEAAPADQRAPSRGATWLGFE
jgi:hypothetical protein